MRHPPKLALVGCGKMGGALLKGWLSAEVDIDITVVQPRPLSQDLLGKGYHYSPNLVPEEQFDIFVIAVKPQVMSEVVAELREVAPSDSLILSVAAGLPLKFFEKRLAESQPIIRVMPNIPAAIGKGVSVGSANHCVTIAQKQITEELLQCVGTFHWLEDESLMDAVTAISGSGPAYVFHMIECLSLAAQNVGLSEELADALARQTVIGAGALAEQTSEASAGNLRRHVMSPGGTTEAGLEVLMSGQWQEILEETVRAALHRSKELSG